MAKDGRLPAMQIPGVRGYRFLKADIANFIEHSMPKVELLEQEYATEI